MLDGAFGTSFAASGDLLLAFGWLIVLGAAVYVLLRRTVGVST
jgi:hypothetical protein